MVKKTVKKKMEKEKVKTKTTKVKPAKKEKEKEREIVEKPVKKVDIDTVMYRDLFKFLDEKVSVECFIDLHEQCYGKADCECQCHAKK
jgi:DNA-nicking Smr family endonuclease